MNSNDLKCCGNCRNSEITFTDGLYIQFKCINGLKVLPGHCCVEWKFDSTTSKKRKVILIAEQIASH